jgi:hypothetical protein
MLFEKSVHEGYVVRMGKGQVVPQLKHYIMKACGELEVKLHIFWLGLEI